MSYSTAIMKVTAQGAQSFGKFIIVGRIPASCYDATRNNGHGGSVLYNTEAEALAAILADEWIKATPEQVIQLANCLKYDRIGNSVIDPDNAQALADFQMQASGRLFI